MLEVLVRVVTQWECISLEICMVFLKKVVRYKLQPIQNTLIVAQYKSVLIVLTPCRKVQYAGLLITILNGLLVSMDM